MPEQTSEEVMRIALAWFASPEAWDVTTKSIEDGRIGFNAPAYSIYSTPWGFARAALPVSNQDSEREGA